MVIAVSNAISIIKRANCRIFLAHVLAFKTKTGGIASAYGCHTLTMDQLSLRRMSRHLYRTQVQVRFR